MSRDSQFWDRISARYARRPVADETAYQKKLEITRGYLRPDMEVLEFGCGTGSTAIAHAPFVNHIRATDISSAMIEIAREKAAAGGVQNVDFEQSTLDDLDVSDASIDVVLGLNILHLVADRDATICRVHAMLKPGGVFVSSTACLGDSMLRLLGFIAPVGRAFGLLPLLRVFTLEDLKTSFREAGFDIDHEWLPGKGDAIFIVARKAH